MTIQAYFNRKIKGTLARWFGIKLKSGSETSKVRHLVLPYCTGRGCDVGFGGDKIKQEDCDGIDFANPYTKVGDNGVDIACDVIKDEIPVADNSYDYVYTSHLIEDFADTGDGLRKFIRVLKPGGNLVLVFPDQQKYEAYCRKTGQTPNPYHVHKNMGMDYMLARLSEMKDISLEILFSSNCQIDYNVILVLRISKKGMH